MAEETPSDWTARLEKVPKRDKKTEDENDSGIRILQDYYSAMDKTSVRMVFRPMVDGHSGPIRSFVVLLFAALRKSLRSS